LSRTFFPIFFLVLFFGLFFELFFGQSPSSAFSQEISGKISGETSGGFGDNEFEKSLAAQKILKYKPYSIGFEGGWDTPLGNGLSLSYNIIPRLEFLIGGGWFLPGPRMGVGARIFLGDVEGRLVKGLLKPFLGITFSESLGLSEPVFIGNNEYKVRRSQLFNVVFGMEKEFQGFFKVNGHLGWGLRTDGDGVTEIGFDGDSSQRGTKAFFLYNPGGLILGFGVAYLFNYSLSRELSENLY